MEKSTHTPEYAALRSELRKARENAGLSQRELASRLKVPHSWVANVESGERRIDVVELCWLMLACDANPIPICKDLIKRISKKQHKRETSRGVRK